MTDDVKLAEIVRMPVPVSEAEIRHQKKMWTRLLELVAILDKANIESIEVNAYDDGARDAVIRWRKP